MDVNQVRFGEYYIGTSSGRNANRERKAEKEEQAPNMQAQAMPSADREDILNALNITGAQNFAFVSKTEVQAPNPADYLDEARISDIEAMMAEFDNGVNQVADIIEAEFPNMFAPDVKNSMAARIFAAE